MKIKNFLVLLDLHRNIESSSLEKLLLSIEKENNGKEIIDFKKYNNRIIDAISNTIINKDLNQEDKKDILVKNEKNIKKYKKLENKSAFSGFVTLLLVFLGAFFLESMILKLLILFISVFLWITSISLSVESSIIKNKVLNKVSKEYKLSNCNNEQYIIEQLSLINNPKTKELKEKLKTHIKNDGNKLLKKLLGLSIFSKVRKNIKKIRCGEVGLKIENKIIKKIN